MMHNLRRWEIVGIRCLLTLLSGLLLACLLFQLVTRFASTKVEASPATVSLSFLYTVAQSYEPLAWMSGANRFPRGARIFLREPTGLGPTADDSTRQHALMASFAESADPAISFDGKRVIFAGKKRTQDPWQIWEVELAQGEPRQITSGREDCIRPLYLSDDRVVYARKVSGRFVIETGSLTGGTPVQLTYGPANYVPTDVLRDGRILFQAAYPLGTDSTPEIYTVYSDGSGVESYRCDHSNRRYQGRQISSGDIVFATSGGLRQFTLAQFTSACAHELAIAAPAGEYTGDVAELPSGNWLLPWRPSQKDHFQVVTGTAGLRTLHVSVADPNNNVVQPVVVAVRAAPKRHPSGLHDWPNGNLLCLNAYTSKYRLSPGSIHSVRFYSRIAKDKSRLLGTAPVERDGSFFVTVPTEQALQIELLDSTGKTLKREAGFFWMRRGEQRVCVGCHAGPETAPENSAPLILLKSTTPADLTRTNVHNASRRR